MNNKLRLKASDYYNDKPAENPWYASDAAKGSATGIGSMAAGFLTGGTGFIVTGAMQIGAGIINALFGESQEPALTPEQQQFQTMVNRYHNMGERARVSKGMMVALGSTPAKAEAALGFRTNREMMKKYPMQRTTTAPVTATTKGKRKADYGDI